MLKKKSITQMTKAELIEVIRSKDQLVAKLNAQIDDLESMAVSSVAVPLNADVTDLINSLRQKINDLENQLNIRK